MKKLIALLLILAMVPAAALADDSIAGKWSCYFDVTKTTPEEQKVMDASLIVYDLYLMEDGTAYMASATMMKTEKKPDFSYGALSGVWLSDNGSIVIRVSDSTYKASIDDDGYMLVYFTKNLPLPFVRIDTTDKMLELIR